MNKKETLSILTILKTAYPSFYRSMPADEVEDIVHLWMDMFADDEGVKVAAAVKALIATDTKGFPPHIGAIKDKLRQITTPESMTEVEAWNLVHKAIKRGYYNSKEEFEKLPPILQRLVGGHSQLRDWSIMDADVVQSVVSSNFQRSFRARSQSEKEYALMPPDVRMLMDEVSGSLSLDSAIGGKHGN